MSASRACVLSCMFSCLLGVILIAASACTDRAWVGRSCDPACASGQSCASGLPPCTACAGDAGCDVAERDAAVSLVCDAASGSCESCPVAISDAGECPCDEDDSCTRCEEDSDCGDDEDCEDGFCVDD